MMLDRDGIVDSINFNIVHAIRQITKGGGRAFTVRRPLIDGATEDG